MGEPRVYTTCKMRHGRIDLRFAPAGSQVRLCQCPGLECAHPDAASLIVDENTIREDAIADARAEIVETIAAWLDMKAGKIGAGALDSATEAQRSAKAGASYELSMAAAAIRSGAPQRWAAEERERA